MVDGPGHQLAEGAATPSTPPSPRRRGLPRTLDRFRLAIALMVVAAVMAAINPRFLSPANVVNILLQSSIVVIIASGQTLAMVSGGFDLSVGSVGIMAGCVAAMAMVATNSTLVGILVGLALGALAGLTNGLSISRLGVNPLVTTLGMSTAARGIALAATGGMVISGLPDAFTWMGVGYLGPVPVPVAIAAVTVIVTRFLLSRTEFGLHVYATGSNPEASRLSGVAIGRTLTSVYTYQGVLAALGGLILTARVLSAQPALMQTTNMDTIAAAVIGGARLGGGRGTVGGSVFGALLLASLFNGLNIIGIGYEFQLVVIGLIIVMAVYADIRRK